MRTRPDRHIQTSRTAGRSVYVSSSSGRAGNDGASPNAPLASIADAMARVTKGSAERLLLRRGDVFTEPIGRWTRAGRSRARPAVIGAYGPGDERPVIRCPGSALEFAAPHGGGELRHVRVTGLHLVAAGRDPDEPGYHRSARVAIGICVRGPGVRRVTIEDCRVEQFDDNVLLDEACDVRLRRCVLLDVVSRGGKPPHSLAVYGCGGTIRVESCVFDQNRPAGAASHHHFFATHGNKHVVVTGCVVARSPGTGLLLDAARNAATGNILAGNRLHLAVGGEEAAVTDNLILGGRERRAASDDSVGSGGTPPHAIWATAGILQIERNLIAQRPRSRTAAIVLTRTRGQEQGRRRRKLTARVAGNIVCGCGGGIEVGRDAAWRTVELVRNNLQRVAAAQAVVSVRRALPNLVVADNRYGTLDPGGDASIRFRLGAERLTFAEWSVRTGDRSQVTRVEPPAPVVCLRRRFVADARTQSGSTWRAHLAPQAVIRRLFRSFELSPEPENLP